MRQVFNCTNSAVGNKG